MSEQDPYNPEDTETQPEDQGPGTGDTVKEEGGLVSPHEAESAQEGTSTDERSEQSEG